MTQSVECGGLGLVGIHNTAPLLCKQRKRCTRFILLKIQNDIRHIVCIFNILHVLVQPTTIVQQQRINWTKNRCFKTIRTWMMLCRHGMPCWSQRRKMMRSICFIYGEISTQKSFSSGFHSHCISPLQNYLSVLNFILLVGVGLLLMQFKSKVWR